MSNPAAAPDFVPPVASRAIGADPRLLEMLVCPITKTALRYDAAAQRLISDAAKLSFPIRDGIPILLISEAERL